jgi:hypothetical protein
MTSSPTRQAHMQAKYDAIRSELWPDLSPDDIWEFNKNTKGYLRIPRIMPLLFRVMDGISKGKPLSNVYLELWCRVMSGGFLIVKDKDSMAFFSGFSGERALRTWRDRIYALEKEGFILIKERSKGDISHLFIINPYKVLWKLKKEHKIPQTLWDELSSRLGDIGALEEFKKLQGEN